jgi:hypothetical protein
MDTFLILLAPTACRIDKIALKVPRKSKEAIKQRILMLEVSAAHITTS